MGFIITNNENKLIAAISIDKSNNGDLDVTFVLEEGYTVKKTVSENESDLGGEIYIPNIKE